jgi:transketolase
MPSKHVDLKVMAHQARRLVIEMAHRAHKGHIGSALSIVDLSVAVAERVFSYKGRYEERPRLALSKGHAATAWYAAMVCMGHLEESEVIHYGANGSLYGTHPDPAQPGTDFMTGSLGQGIGFAVGSAMASKISGNKFRVFSILSDSELNEGSTWESLHIASQHDLGQLTVLLDLNGQQALGMTPDVMNVGDVGDHFASIGWNVLRVDGHDVNTISDAIQSCESSAKPNLIVATTIAGYPISFMMRKVEWHYLPLTDDQYRQALEEIEDDFNKHGANS